MTKNTTYAKIKYADFETLMSKVIEVCKVNPTEGIRMAAELYERERAHIGENDLGFYHYEMAKNLKKILAESEDTVDQLNIYQQLAIYYEKLEEWKLASDYQSKIIELNAQKYEKEKTQTIERLHIQHEVAQKEQKIKIQELELEKKALELEKKKELEKINLQLEKKVIQRTAKLTLQNQQLREFALIVSNDLREPLYNIFNISKSINTYDTKGFSEEVQKFIHQIGYSAQQMNQLLKDLIEYTILEKKIEQDQKEIVNCNVILNETKDVLSSKINESKAIIEASSLPSITTSPLAIKIIFEHLLSNALRFKSSNRPCHIHINCIEHENHYLFSFQDNGIGIAKAHQERIFRVFQRLYKNQYNGTGIGLAACKKIIQLLRGEISVVSTLGQGSTFYFTIPTER